MTQNDMSRRGFLRAASLSALGLAAGGCATTQGTEGLTISEQQIIGFIQQTIKNPDGTLNMGAVLLAADHHAKTNSLFKSSLESALMTMEVPWADVENAAEAERLRLATERAAYAMQTGNGCLTIGENGRGILSPRACAPAAAASAPKPAR